MTGYVYILLDEQARYKIGYTFGDSHKRRLSNLQVGNADKLIAVGCIQSEFADVIEKDLHRRYCHLEIRGEWFLLSEQDVKDILSINGGAYFEGIETLRVPGGRSAFDVRSVRGRQLDTASGHGENVPGQRAAADNPKPQYLFASLR